MRSSDMEELIEGLQRAALQPPPPVKADPEDEPMDNINDEEEITDDVKSAVNLMRSRFKRSARRRMNRKVYEDDTLNRAVNGGDHADPS